MVADNIAAVRKAVACFNNPSTRVGYFSLYDPACEVHGLPPDLPATLAGLQTFYRTLWNAFPDIAIAVKDIFGDGESLAVRFDAQGTHTGDFFGMKADGDYTTFFVIMLLRFSQGRVVERWWQMSIVERQARQAAIEDRAAG
jgi:predicted ester cyclase